MFDRFKLAKIMERKRMNCNQLAARSRLAQPTVFNLLAGRRLNPKITTIQAICSVLEIPIEQILGQDDED